MNGKFPLRNLTIDRLREIYAWVSSVLDLDQLLELIIDTATRMMQAKASSLLLLDPKTKRLYFKVALGDRGEEVRKYELNVGQGIAGYVVETGESLLIPDVTKDPRWDKQISESVGFETRSIACVPMKMDGEIIGVVEIIDKEDGSSIRKEDMKILEVFADLASMAINSGAFVGVFFLGPGDAMLYGLLVFLSGIGFGATLALPSAIQADVIDYDELLTGQRRACMPREAAVARFLTIPFFSSSGSHASQRRMPGSGCSAWLPLKLSLRKTGAGWSVAGR